MRKLFNQSVCLALVMVIFEDPCATAFLGVKTFSSTPSLSPCSSSRFQEEALAVRALSAMHFLYTLPTSFWKDLTVSDPAYSKKLLPPLSWLTQHERDRSREYTLGTGALVAAVTAAYTQTAFSGTTVILIALAQIIIARVLGRWVAEKVHEYGHVRAARLNDYPDAISIDLGGNLIVVHEKDNEPILDKTIAKAGPAASWNLALVSFGLAALIILSGSRLVSPKSFLDIHPVYFTFVSLLMSFLTSVTAASLRFAFADFPQPPDENSNYSTQQQNSEIVATQLMALSPETRAQLLQEGRTFMEDRYYTYLENGFDPQISEALKLTDRFIYMAFAMALLDNKRGLKAFRDNGDEKSTSRYLLSLEDFKTWDKKQRVTVKVDDPPPQFRPCL